MVRPQNRISVLVLCSIITLLLAQWLFVDFTFVIEPGVNAAQGVLVSNGRSAVQGHTGAVQSVPSPLDVLFALQMLLGMVLPTAWTFHQLKSARVLARSSARKQPLYRNNPQNNFYVAPLRQWCASPDAHGP